MNNGLTGYGGLTDDADTVAAVQQVLKQLRGQQMANAPSQLLTQYNNQQAQQDASTSALTTLQKILAGGTGASGSGSGDAGSAKLPALPSQVDTSALAAAAGQRAAALPPAAALSPAAAVNTTLARVTSPGNPGATPAAIANQRLTRPTTTNAPAAPSALKPAAQTPATPSGILPGKLQRPAQLKRLKEIGKLLGPPRVSMPQLSTF